jgi:CheY-like chemotaxis protein
MNSHKRELVIVADAVGHTRNLLTEVLRGSGFDNVRHAPDGARLVEMTKEMLPRIVITTSRLPKVSGLEFTRLVRKGYGPVPRNLGIVAMSDTATRIFLEAARDSGVDEILVRPFTAQAIMHRVQAVLERQREFIDSARYVGPCRRRRQLADYTGPMRRFIDPVDEDSGHGWDTPGNLALMKQLVARTAENFQAVRQGDRIALRAAYDAAKEVEANAQRLKDDVLVGAARSICRYVVAVGSVNPLDPEAVSAHMNGMARLCALTASQHGERQKILDDLARLIDAKLGRTQAA